MYRFFKLWLYNRNQRPQKTASINIDSKVFKNKYFIQKRGPPYWIRHLEFGDFETLNSGLFSLTQKNPRKYVLWVRLWKTWKFNKCMKSRHKRRLLKFAMFPKPELLILYFRGGLYATRSWTLAAYHIDFLFELTIKQKKNF